MNSDVGDNHLPESLSGPCGWFRYHGLHRHKVTKPKNEALLYSFIANEEVLYSRGFTLRHTTIRLQLMRHDTIQIHLLRYDTLPIHPMRHDTIQIHQMRQATIQTHLMRHDTIHIVHYSNSPNETCHYSNTSNEAWHCAHCHHQVTVVTRRSRVKGEKHVVGSHVHRRSIRGCLRGYSTVITTSCTVCDVTRLRKPSVRGLSGFASNRCREYRLNLLR
jgi:hypothetical protein